MKHLAMSLIAAVLGSCAGGWQPCTEGALKCERDVFSTDTTVLLHRCEKYSSFANTTIIDWEVVVCRSDATCESAMAGTTCVIKPSLYLLGDCVCR